MKKLLQFANLSIAFTFVSTTFSYSQVNVNTGATPAQMVANLVGPGITYSNVSYTGDAIASGIFTNGNVTNLGMTSGVVLTSGNAALVPINNSGNQGADNSGASIPELDAIAGAGTYDGAILEFDFIPYSNSLNVRYIFGSDEYLEWVNLGYNDAFAFFISGPGIVGQQNLATVAGQPVTIDNINTTLNSAFYVNNPYDGSLAANRIEYDGFTAQLLASRAVIPCSTYHIKLMIADGGDAIYDSGVFIEENGFFSSGAITDVAVQPAYGFGTGVEGCQGTQFVFTMPNVLATNSTFNYTVGGTAISGVDYVPIPNSITIPAGQTTATIPVDIIDDAVAEGAETITLTVQISPCSTQTFTLTINDPTPVNVTAVDASFCQGMGPVNISANATGGNGTLTYSWDNGAGNGSPVSVNPGSTSTYTVTATDQCGRTATDMSTVTVTPPPTSTFTATATVCQGSASTLTYTGNAPAGATYNWNFAGGTASPGTTTQGPHTVTWGTAGTYNVALSVTDNGCTSAPSTQTVTVNPTPATPTIGSNSPICTGGSINLTANTIAGATYNWTGPNAFTSALEDPSLANATVGMAGTYNLYVVANSCTSATASVPVLVNTTPVTPTISSNTPVCSGNAINLTANTIAGATYNWTGPNAFTSATEDPTIASATVAMAGTYNLYLTANGCTSATASTPVVVNATPATPTVGSNSPICTGNAINLTANTIAGAAYNWTGPNTFTSAVEDPSLANATVGMAGTYNLYLTANGCTSATASVPVLVNTTPVTPTISSNTPVCSGNAINLTANTIAGATYNWTGPNAFTSATEDPTIASATVAMGGTYNLYVVATGCTSGTASTAVVVNATPVTPTVGSNSPICTGNAINLTANTIAGATYNWTGPNTFTSALEDPSLANATVGMAGTYNLYLTANGCTSATASVPVVVNTTPALPVIGSNSPVCAGNTLNLTANTVAGATYSWSGPNAFASAVEDPTVANVTVAASGNYSLYVTVTGCSSATANLNVAVTPLPATPTVSSNSPVCENGSINLSANTLAGATYHWSGPGAYTSTVEDPILTPAGLAMGGNYSLYVVASGCTSATASTPVVVNATPVTPTVGSNTPVCASNALNLTANTIAGATYVWSGPNAFSASVEDPTIAAATVAASGNYSLQVVVLACSSATANVNVVVNPVPSAPSIGSNGTVCESGNIEFTASTIAGATYVWSGPNAFSSSAQNPNISPAVLASAGNYSAYVVVLGCTSGTAITPVTVNATPATPVISGGSAVCEGGTVQLTANTLAGAAYHWTGPGAYTSTVEDPTLSPAGLNMGGNYSLYVVVTGCTSATATTPVVVNPLPATPGISSNSPLCEGQAMNLSSNAPAGQTFYWTGPNGFASSDAAPTATGTLNMAGNYSLYTVALGCTSGTASIPVVVNVVPVADFAVTPQICLGTNAFALYNGTAPSGATYDWQVTGSPTVAGSGQGPITLTWNTPGVHSMSLTVTQNGCPSAPVAHDVTIIPQVIPDAGPDQTLCSGSTINVGSQGATGADFTWTTPNGIGSPASAYSTASWVNNGNAPLTVTITLQSDNQGCLATDNATMTVVPNPTAAFTVPVAQCFTDNNFSFTAGGNYMPTANFQWTFANATPGSAGTQNPADVHFTSTGSNDVTLVITQDGCPSAPVTQAITVMPAPQADFANLPAEGCMPLEVDFTDHSVTGTGAVTYSWDFGYAGAGSTDASPLFTYTQPGVYGVSLTVTDANGCKSTITRNNIIRVYANPVAGFTVNPQVIYIDEPFANVYDGSTGNVVSWQYDVEGGGQFDVEQFTVNFTDTGYYDITQTVSNEFGCKDVFMQAVHILPVSQIYVPNAFTPGNRDDLNAIFKPLGYGLSEYKMYIYNRWGEMLFSTADLDIGWDGQVRNSPVEAKQDLYVYKIQYVDHRGNPKELLGNVMVVR